MTERLSALIDELHASEETLTPSLRERIVAEGPATVPRLIEVLLEGEDEDGETGGWSPIHAVDLLVDLKAEAAIDPMLRIIAETDWDFVIHSRIVLRLPELGTPVLEPALSMLAGAPPDHVAEARAAASASLSNQRQMVFFGLMFVGSLASHVVQPSAVVTDRSVSSSQRGCPAFNPRSRSRRSRSGCRT